MEYFNFEPSDYQVLEDIEFDETFQRAEKVRFFTLTEQTTDAYEKLMPRGRVTRFQREEVRKEIDRLQDLYRQYVLALPEEYTLREPSYRKHFDWIHPVYADRSYKRYDWATQWQPLFDNLRLPGFYPRMLAALPIPYGDTSEGVPYRVETPTTFVSSSGDEQWRVLPEYMMIRTQRHEDKTIDIVKVPVEGTQDVVSFVGYYLDKRPMDIPNPFPEHPFLMSREASFVKSTAPLKDVVPSLDAILTHGVPVTKNPFIEATPYLKLYDVQLRDIPWSAWKSKFQPVETIHEAPPAEPIELPKSSQIVPPDSILETYQSTYDPGVSLGLWLMNQVDGGGLVPQLLRSKVIDNGSVESIPGVDLPMAAYPATTIEECTVEGKSFQQFLVSGILRRTGNVLQCVPLEFIRQERARAGYLNRLPWAETTSETLKQTYINSLGMIRPIGGVKEKNEVTSKTPQRPDSIRRAEVLAILEDPRRFAEDKLRDIHEILRATTFTQHIYSDTDDLFVCCGHTLAILGGDLADDRHKFYETWTAKVDGFRVCKFCGEHINTDVFVDQVQFDEDGFVIRRAEAFEETVFHGEGIRTFTSGLTALRPLFLDDNSHDDMVLLLLTILQVLPTADKLEPLLKFGRTIAGAQFAKGSLEQTNKLKGATGIATAALILQTHIPTLIPRRSFGTKPLKLTGYPRDADTPDQFSIVDTLMLVLRKTFESFPTSFKGPAKQTISAVLDKPGEIKTAVTNLLSLKSPLLKGLDKLPSPVPGLLANARAFYAENPPPVEQPNTLIPVFAPPKELGVIHSFVGCPSARPIWTSGRPTQTVQFTVQLRNGIRTARNAIRVPPSVSTRVVPVSVTKEQVRSRLAKERGNQTRIQIRDAPLTNLAIASRISDLFFLNEPIRTVDTQESTSMLRDVSRGLLAETLAEVQSDAGKRTKLEELRTKDVALYTLTADYKEEKANVNRLVATERMKFVQRMAQRSDAEREVLQDLLRIGLAPYVISRADREEFAREAERLREEVYRDEQSTQEEDIGVGQPSDVFEQGEEGPRGVDNGDYGDYVGLPGNDGRDHEQPQQTDDPERPI